MDRPQRCLTGDAGGVPARAVLALALQLAAESSCAREGGGGDRDWTIQKVARTLTAAVMRRISLQHLVFLVTA
jgi:hypothetical protein